MAELGAATSIMTEEGLRLVRDVRPFEVRYRGRAVTVQLPGYYPEQAGQEDEAVFVGDDMAAADEALKLLRQQIDGVPSPQEIRAFRADLSLSQREAGNLLKVGENAFDKYERGLVEPSGPTVQLIKLLRRHPELVEELR